MVRVFSWIWRCPSATLPPFLSSDAREGGLQSWRRASTNNQHQDCCQASKDFARSARTYFSLMPLPLSHPLSLQAIITRKCKLGTGYIKRTPGFSWLLMSSCIEDTSTQHMGIFIQHTTAMRKDCSLYLETAYPDNEDVTEAWPNHQNPVPKEL